MQDLARARLQAVEFASRHVQELAREMIQLSDTGLMPAGRLAELRELCGFAGSSAQSLSLTLATDAAIRRLVAIEPLLERLDVSEPDDSRYAQGRAAAERWIAAGGALNADGPDTDEAYFNGFIDCLAEARRASRGATAGEGTCRSRS